MPPSSGGSFGVKAFETSVRKSARPMKGRAKVVPCLRSWKGLRQAARTLGRLSKPDQLRHSVKSESRKRGDPCAAGWLNHDNLNLIESKRFLIVFNLRLYLFPESFAFPESTVNGVDH